MTPKMLQPELWDLEMFVNFHGKRSIKDVIKLRLSRWGDDFGFSLGPYMEA